MATTTQIERRKRLHVSEPRMTSVGKQYIVINGHATEIVTVNSEGTRCTCGLACDHIEIVQQIEAAYCVEARDRAQYSLTFGV